MPFIVEVQDERGSRLAGFAVLRDEYRFADRTHITVRSDVGWCHDCNAFALVERIMTVGELEHEAEEYFYARYPEERTPYMQPVMRQVLQWKKQEAVRAYQPLLNYLPHRSSPPRCLECGGVRFVRFEEWNQWYERPGADGRFQVVCRGHISVGTDRLFDPEGARLHGGEFVVKAAPR